jgi:hypothetical protein
MTARRERSRPQPEVAVVGRPHFELRPEDREAIADLLADLLIAALQREAEEQRPA